MTISQGIFAMCLRYGGICNDYFVENIVRSLSVKMCENTSIFREDIDMSRVSRVFDSQSTSTVSRFGERSSDGQYSLVSFLFTVLILTVPLPFAQPFVKKVCA